MNKLPIVKVPYKLQNPTWEPQYGGDGRCTNMEGFYLPEAMLDAEVLTINLNASGMRVRLVEKMVSRSHPKGQVITFDTDIKYFNELFEIKERA